MKILVTGTAGFIGGHLAERLAADGHAVLGLDHRKGERSDLFSQRTGDLLDREGIRRLLRDFQPEAVVHLAARTDLDETADLGAYAANVEGVTHLVDAIRQTGSVRRAIFTSSQLVCRVGYTPRDDRDYAPNTVYGRSKVETERIVREMDGGGVEWCLVRPTTVWGPGMSRHYQKLFRLIDRGLYFHVGEQPLYKSFGYVGNVVHQYARFLEAPSDQIAGRTFYAADYEPLSMRGWTDEIQKRLGAPRIRSVPVGLARAVARAGDALGAAGVSTAFNTFRLTNVLTEYVFDLRDTERVCGPLPYSVDRAIDETVEWLRRLGLGRQTSTANPAHARTRS